MLESHEDEVWHIAFSHSGLLLASASKDRAAIVWELGPDGLLRQLHRLVAHEQPVCYLSWSPDDSKLLTCRWGLGRACCGWLGAAGGAARCCIEARGAAGSCRRRRCCSHLPHARPTCLPSAPAPPTHTLSPHTPRSEDTKLRLWDVASGQLLRTFSQHRDAVTCCCWMPDSRRFLSAGPDKAIFMFDTAGNELQRWRRQHRVQVRSAPGI